MDSNASYAGEVERKVWRDNDSLLRGQLLKSRSSLSASPLCQPSESEGQRRPAAAGIGATALRNGPDDARPIAIVELRSRLVSADVPR